MALKRGAKWAIALAVVVVCGAGGTYWFVGGPNRPKAAAQEEAATVKVQRGNIRVSVSGTSQLQTQVLQNVTASADGTIKTMNLTRSMPVKQGDVLLEISNEQIESALKDAQSSLQTAEDELNDLIEQQQHMSIIAPEDGRLELGNMDVGSSVSKSAKIGTIADEATLTVKLPYPFEEAAQFKAGDPVDLTVAGYALTKTGTVRSVGTSLKADAAGNRLVEVLVAVDNDGTLSAGMDVTGSVIQNGREIAAKASAKLEPAKTVALLSGASGTVTELRKKSGDLVKAGDVIAVLANDSLDSQIKSKQTAVERQRQTVEQAQKRVDDLTIRAPFDGVFSTDFASQKTNVLASYPVGASVKQGDLFGSVTSFDMMTLPIQVDELDLMNIKPGLKAEVTVDAVSGRRFEGEVTQVSTVGTTTNGVTYYDAIVSVPNKDGLLKYGMTATAEILIQDRQNVLTLPVEALRISRGGVTVTVKKPDGTLQENVQVQIGARSKTAVEITSGLSEGDEVVVPTRQRTADGTQQQIEELRRQFQNGNFPAGGGGGGVFMFPAGGGGAGGGGQGGQRIGGGGR